MRRRGTVLALAMISVFVAACSSSGDSAPSSSAPPPPTVATTTEPAPSTTAPPTTTEPPTTTLDPAATLAAEVEADFRRGGELLNLALMDVSDQERVDEALGFLDGDSRRSVEEFVQQYRDDNYRILTEPLIEPAITIERPAIEDQEHPGVMVLQACEIDPWVVVEIGAGPGGADAVVDRNIYAYRNTIRLRQIDSVWAVFESVQIGEWSGVEQCPAE